MLTLVSSRHCPEAQGATAVDPCNARQYACAMAAQSHYLHLASGRTLSTKVHDCNETGATATGRSTPKCQRELRQALLQPTGLRQNARRCRAARRRKAPRGAPQGAARRRRAPQGAAGRLGERSTYHRERASGIGNARGQHTALNRTLATNIKRGGTDSPPTRRHCYWRMRKVRSVVI